MQGPWAIPNDPRISEAEAQRILHAPPKPLEVLHELHELAQDDPFRWGRTLSGDPFEPRLCIDCGRATVTAPGVPTCRDCRSDSGWSLAT